MIRVYHKCVNVWLSIREKKKKNRVIAVKKEREKKGTKI